MLQIVDFQLNGTTFKLKEMSFKQARQHVNEGRELMKRGDDVTSDEWYDRTIKTVASAIVDMQGFDEGSVEKPWTIERLQDELSVGSINTLFMKVLEISGLKMPPGGVTAA
ncbi:MAG TPA: hypothetical protein VND65_14935 [Candidatus Binatia bacterium]|nr:hypothetical protein [Candidatus Binatia bacterium]